MSIYSGFATRNLETLYNRAVANLIHLLQSQLAVILRTHTADQANMGQWVKSYSKNYQFMCKLERQKHLQPNFSSFCEDLNAEIGLLSSKMGTYKSDTSLKDLNLHILKDGLAYDDSRTPLKNDDAFSIRSQSNKPRFKSSPKKIFYSPQKFKYERKERHPLRNRMAAIYEKRAYKRIIK